MRRTIVIVLAVLAALLGAAPPANAGGGGWVPLPSPPFDLAAGLYCGFGVHGDPTVDEVRVKTIEEYPDGSPKRQLATGALKYRLTNTGTGASTIADAGGSAIFEFFPDGTRKWHVIGPVLAGFREGGANIPKGLWTLDGIYDIFFSATNVKTVTFYRGGVHDLCADLG